VIVGPGSLYTSILPVLLVDGVAATLSGVRATRIYVSNLMTEPGETDNHSLEQHLDVIERHVGLQLFDHVVANYAPIPPMTLTRYADAACVPVARRTAGPTYRGVRIVERPLAWQIDQGKIRHEPLGLAQAIDEIMHLSRSAESEHAHRATA